MGRDQDERRKELNCNVGLTKPQPVWGVLWNEHCPLELSTLGWNGPALFPPPCSFTGCSLPQDGNDLGWGSSLQLKQSLKVLTAGMWTAVSWSHFPQLANTPLIERESEQCTSRLTTHPGLCHWAIVPHLIYFSLMDSSTYVSFMRKATFLSCSPLCPQWHSIRICWINWFGDIFLKYFFSWWLPETSLHFSCYLYWFRGIQIFWLYHNKKWPILGSILIHS